MNKLSGYLGWLSLFVLFVGVSFGQSGSRSAIHSFGWKGTDFLLDGKPFIIRSGEMHYPRVPRASWRDRFKKARALGLNTITTYVFWNLHESKRGQFDFSGNLDLAEFVREADEEGLYVILRPGPYVCTEWDFGGLPAWLLSEKDMKARTTDPRFLKASKLYLTEVGKRLSRLEIAKGGNILMVQVENEYGSFGNDGVYKEAIKKQIQDAGFTGQLFTSDGPLDYMLKGGTLPDVLSVINFGVDSKDSAKDAKAEFENFSRFRQNVPRMVGEYWVGWFDHWGKPHHTVAKEHVATGLDWMLKNGISFNLYMFHGGTTFGFMNGANYSKSEPYSPDTSSYDYDSPLDEAGRPTGKYYAIREVIKNYLPKGEFLPDVPKSSDLIEIPAFELKEISEFPGVLGKPMVSEKPLSMEEIGQNYGFIMYRKKIEQDRQGELKIDGLRDYGHIFINGELIGRLDRRLKEEPLKVSVKRGDKLDILVENGGRLNFGKEFIFDRKGIVGGVLLDGDDLTNWQIFGLPLSDLSELKFKKGAAKANMPHFYRGSFNLKTVGDTYLDTSSFGKGHVWVNGHHLGRFWKIGPQQTLFVPGGWLKTGKSDVIVFDVESPKQTVLTGVKRQIFANQ